ncbi:hypothetical protein TcasGA2_TC031603 [Tribolium castaneum]|uniref:Uncharacterized protein n=1 Tax=Tribolium castaneum TaxID=7070 RepID=A0A139WA56_TRICA|nr:hypothetical protein TcasGA2_TC031603 [Tribolium castaneum]
MKVALLYYQLRLMEPQRIFRWFKFWEQILRNSIHLKRRFNILSQMI